MTGCKFARLQAHEESLLMDSPTSKGRGLVASLRHGRLTATFAVLGALSIGILAGSMLTGRVSGKEQAKVDSSDARPLSIPSPVTLSNVFSGIAKQAGPAVVNINTEQLPKQSAAKTPRRGSNRRSTPNDGDQGDMQDFFNRFFGGNPNGGGGGGDEDGPDTGERRALGSGFIVDGRGYIITNNHVVDKADHIYVKLSTDPEGGPGEFGRPATVVGVDPATDVAVIKIDVKQPLPTIKLGNSDGAQVGDWVLAIGSPFGLSKTVSAGIVSAVNRSNLERGGGTVDNGQFQHFIQTDAAINPGNSGGPLVDMAGEVIGMNTAIYTQSMGSEGVGFAMPSNTLINVYNMLIGPDHKVTRGSIGIQFQAAQSAAVGRMYGFSNGGVLVSTITPNGPAAKAGLQAQDVITSVDGKPVKDGDELVAIISERRPGSTVRLGYLRAGKAQTAEISIADRSKLFASINEQNEDAGPNEEADAGQGKLGISVQPTPPAVATKLGTKGGVTITNVRPGSFADEIGLGRGVIITEINRKAITDESTYRSVVSGMKSGDDVVFVIRDPRVQNGGNTFVGGTLP